MSEISNEKIQWLHDAATEFASTGMKMTMNPDEVLQLTTPLLALRKEREAAVPVYQMRLIDGTEDQTIWVEVSNEEFNTPLKNPDEWERRILYTAPPAQPVAVPNEVVESLNLLLRRSYFRWWLKDPRGYVGGSIPVSDLVNVVLFADACRAAMLAAPGKEG
ncbi:hypothetical protein ACN5PR_002311 [Cronobacter dublinensis]